MLDIKLIQEILARGNTVEIKKRRNEIIILEVQRKIKESVLSNGKE